MSPPASTLDTIAALVFWVSAGLIVYSSCPPTTKAV